MTHAICKSKHREKGARAEDCVRLYDGLVKAALELDRVATLEGVPPAIAEQLVVQSECYRQLFSAARCYYIAHLRLAKGDKENEAVGLALFGAVLERLAAARQADEGITGHMPPQQQVLLSTMEQEAAAYTVVAQAQLAYSLHQEEGKLAGSLKVCNLIHTVRTTVTLEGLIHGICVERRTSKC